MSAEVVTAIAECRSVVGSHRDAGQRIGLVPTMGALHEGHLSLIDIARSEADRVVVSVFVNPTQFGPNDDYDAYPRDLDRDAERAGERGADLIFAPDRTTMYRKGAVTEVTMRGMTDVFEGAMRPGHFDGVLTIVCKLFHIVEPDIAVFGRKDAQQLAIIRRMVCDLDMAIRVVAAPTIRDSDGLACSSRNVFLSPTERKDACTLHRALRAGRDLERRGERTVDVILEAIREELAKVPTLVIDYLAVVDPDTFEPIDLVGGEAIAILAARVGSTRLIDNEILGDGDE